MHAVGISAMFHSLQPTSSLGVGKHEQDYSFRSANTNWDGKFNCIKKKYVLFHPSLPQQSGFGLTDTVYCCILVPLQGYFNLLTLPYLNKPHFELPLAAGIS